MSRPGIDGVLQCETENDQTPIRLVEARNDIQEVSLRFRKAGRWTGLAVHKYLVRNPSMKRFKAPSDGAHCRNLLNFERHLAVFAAKDEVNVPRWTSSLSHRMASRVAAVMLCSSAYDTMLMAPGLMSCHAIDGAWKPREAVRPRECE
jgi:hypothetical protein